MEASEQTAGEVREAPENTATPEAPPAESGPPQNGPDVGEALASIKDTLERMQQPQEESSGALTDLLYDFDAQEGEEPAYQGEQPQAEQQDPYADRFAHLEQRNAALEQHIVGREEQQRLQQIDALEDQYPDIRENFPKIGAVIEQMEAAAGQDLPITASLIETTYKALKADAASATEKPAEEAKSSGASLETDAGAGGDDGEQSEEDQIRNAILNAKGPKSAFT